MSAQLGGIVRRRLAQPFDERSARRSHLISAQRGFCVRGDPALGNSQDKDEEGEAMETGNDKNSKEMKRNDRNRPPPEAIDTTTFTSARLYQKPP